MCYWPAVTVFIICGRLAKLIGQGRFQTYVVGHLPKEEAKRYWEQHVLTRKEMAFHEPPTFENAYAICGGSMSVSLIRILHRLLPQWWDATT